MLKQTINAIGIIEDCRFSNATTPKNQQTANAGWKNKENLIACLKSAKSWHSLELCSDRSAIDSAPKSNFES